MFVTIISTNNFEICLFTFCTLVEKASCMLTTVEQVMRFSASLGGLLLPFRNGWRAPLSGDEARRDNKERRGHAQQAISPQS